MKLPTCVTTGVITYAGLMVTNLLAGVGDTAILVAAALVLVCAGVLFSRWWRTPRSPTDLTRDPSVSTLVFPPESKLH